MPKHTPREIVKQCKLRWEVSEGDLLDDIKNVRLTTID